MTYLYALGLGSNRRHGRHGAPHDVLTAAIEAIRDARLNPVAVSPILTTDPLGPARRRFANAAMVVRSAFAPPAMLRQLKEIERAIGRRRGQRWGDRVIDLDILLWSAGRWSSRMLTIPHPQLVHRRFVLGPLAEIAPDWRIPGHYTVRQHLARLTRPRPIHRSHRRLGP